MRQKERNMEEEPQNCRGDRRQSVEQVWRQVEWLWKRHGHDEMKGGLTVKRFGIEDIQCDELEIEMPVAFD